MDLDEAPAESAAALGALLGAATYLATTATGLGLLYYLPTRGQWSASIPPGVIAMDWFFRAFYTLFATALGALIGRRWTLPRPVARGVFRLSLSVLAWSLGFTVLSLAASR